MLCVVRKWSINTFQHINKEMVFLCVHLIHIVTSYRHQERSFAKWWAVRLVTSLWWCHNGRDSVSNHQPHHCLFNRLFRRRSKKTSKLCVTGLCVGNSPGTGEFPAQMASNAGNVSIWWRHHVVMQWMTPIRWNKRRRVSGVFHAIR